MFDVRAYPTNRRVAKKALTENRRGQLASCASRAQETEIAVSTYALGELLTTLFVRNKRLHNLTACWTESGLTHDFC